MPPSPAHPDNHLPCASAMLACHECDLLQTLPGLYHHDILCCRCGSRLRSHRADQLHLSQALLVASLLVFLLANAFPVVQLQAGGVHLATTLFGTAWQLSQEGMAPIALLIVLTGGLLPGVELLSMLYLLLPLSQGRVPPGFAHVMRILRVLHPWGMIEVFLLGVLVALVKLAHLAEVHAGIGLWSFFALILLLAGNAYCFDADLLWERHQACKKAH